MDKQKQKAVRKAVGQEGAFVDMPNQEIKELQDSQKQIEEGVISLHSWEPAKSGVACLLCGKFIETDIPRPIICKSCKELWERLKEKDNEQEKAND